MNVFGDDGDVGDVLAVVRPALNEYTITVDENITNVRNMISQNGAARRTEREGVHLKASQPEIERCSDFFGACFQRPAVVKHFRHSLCGSRTPSGRGRRGHGIFRNRFGRGTDKVSARPEESQP